ncbi:TonB family protein [Robiginitalea sp. IMCC43444]|uniref:TonB family protein n=1 Tax=Robiginitalea sp. IMCC43444 TaxID=3459121 RepID=UPI004041AE5E
MMGDILETIGFQAAFLLLYQYGFSRNTFFTWNRLYLLGSCLLSFILPFAVLEPIRTILPAPEFLQPFETGLIVLPEITLRATGEEFSGLNLIPFFWVLGTLVCGVFFCLKLWRILRKRKEGNLIPGPGFTLIRIEDKRLAFSFFKWVFVGSGFEKKEEQVLLTHEGVHVRQWHSLDILLLELLRIVFWFNPLLWLYQRKLSEIHEFLADRASIKNGRKQYYQQMLSQVFQVKSLELVNPFYKNSSIKKRIVMSSKQNSHNRLKLNYLILLPVLAGMLVYVSCMEQPKEDPSVEDLVEEIATASEYEQIQEKVRNSDMTTENKEKVMRLIEEARQAEASNTAKSGSTDIIFLENQKENNSSVIDNQTGEAVPFAVIDEVPVFPGCEEAEDKRACFNEKIMEHIMKHFSYPEEAEEKGIEGRVVVMFTIGKDGQIRDIKKRGPDPLLEAEVDRIISTLPKMQAGRQNGRAVDVPFSVPITFKLD